MLSQSVAPAAVEWMIRHRQLIQQIVTRPVGRTYVDSRYMQGECMVCYSTIHLESAVDGDSGWTQFLSVEGAWHLNY